MLPCTVRVAVVAALLAAATACGERLPAPGDAAADGDAADGDRDPGSDSAADREADEADAPPDSGPLMHLLCGAELVEDRLCDLDGDGANDNAIADLGPPATQMVLTGFNSLAESGVAQAPRVATLFPWVDDLATPSAPDTSLILFEVVDLDVPADRADDCSGNEELWAAGTAVDACGEPLRRATGVVIDEGSLEAVEVGELPIPTMPGLSLSGARAWGWIEPGGAAAELFTCGYARVAALGGAAAPLEGTDLTLLEMALSGGAAFGFPAVSGIEPDVDLDGDGLERITLDEQSHVAACIDGDSTEIVGPDCWQDDRIADAFSFNARLAGVAARFAGLVPDWRQAVFGTCTDPPETSAWPAR